MIIKGLGDKNPWPISEMCIEKTESMAEPDTYHCPPVVLSVSPINFVMHNVLVPCSCNLLVKIH